MFLIKTQGFSDKSTALKRGSALKMFSFQSGSLRTVPKFQLLPVVTGGQVEEP